MKFPGRPLPAGHGESGRNLTVRNVQFKSYAARIPVGRLGNLRAKWSSSGRRPGYHA
jgi:hypothetical protein